MYKAEQVIDDLKIKDTIEVIMFNGANRESLMELVNMSIEYGKKYKEQ